MARKKEEVVIDKKTREKLTNEILEEINTNVKADLCKTVVEEVKESIDIEYKNELKEEISNELIVDIKAEIKKEEKKLYRRKNFKIFRLYVYIILLIAVAIYAIYKLYMTGNLEILEKYNGNKETTTKEIVSNKEIKDFAWYYNKYGKLLDNIYITNYELLKGDYIFKDVDITDKLAMSYKAMDDEFIIKEGIIYTVAEDNLKNAYKTIFGSENGYLGGNFAIDGLNYAYSATNKNYIAISSANIKDNYILNNIIDIKEDSNSIIITSKIALIADNKVYNIFNVSEELGVYNVDEGLNKYVNSLSTVDYTFEKNGDNYYIYSVSKK